MDHLDTFEDWLKFQQMVLEGASDEVAAAVRGMYEHDRRAAVAPDAHVVVRGPCPEGKFRYAIAIEDGPNLWLTLWIKRSTSGECFIMYPRGRGGWNPHASRHRDGTYHQKSYNHKSLVQHRHPLDQFRGAEHLGSFYGHGMGVGACDPDAFTAVLRIPMGILEPTRGSVLVDLVEPGHAPAPHHRNVPGLRIVAEETYRDCSPWVVVAVAEQTRIC